MVTVQSLKTPGPRLAHRASASPLTKSTRIRSPNRVSREGQCLRLQRIIGNTITSPSCFDGLSKSRCFAYTAGGAVVLVRVTEDSKLEETFYRAKSPVSTTQPGATYDSHTVLGTPTPRNRNLGLSRDAWHVPSPSGAPTSDVAELNSPRPGSARERTKAATCVSLSPDGRLLAFGETGHKPRILLFSAVSDASTDTPMAVLSEHSFGVRFLAFSPDSQFLASLGDINDGFLHIWKFNQRTGSASLHASNKCTSNIKGMAWMGNNLVTVGTRHVKVWRVEKATLSSPSKRVAMNEAIYAPASPSRALSGRNCVLGALLHRTFTAVTALDDTRAVLCSDQGDVCLLEDDDAPPSIRKVAEAGFEINAVARTFDDTIFVGGQHLKRYDLKELLNAGIKPDSESTVEKRSAENVLDCANVMVLSTVGGHVVTVDSDKTIQLLRLQNDHTSWSQDLCSARRLPSHRSAVQGVQQLCSPNLPGVSFLTFSAEGTFLFWTAGGTLISQMKAEVDQVSTFEDTPYNSLCAARACPSHNLILAGDRIGNLKFFEFELGESIESEVNIKIILQTKAHQGKVTDIAAREDESGVIVASSGRDRTIQIFEKIEVSWRLTQTLEDHRGAVSGLAFSSDGKKLVSFSLDRNIIIRDAVGGRLKGEDKTVYVPIRTINVKATPLSIAMHPDGEETFLVSTAGKHVFRYALHSGATIESFKVLDEEGEAVNLCSVVQIPGYSAVEGAAGIASADKSIRLYNNRGSIVGREYGHVEAITGISMIGNSGNLNDRKLVTVATDGTILMWDICGPFAQENEATLSPETFQATPKLRDPFVLRPPLRKVISTSELMQLRGVCADDESAVAEANGGRSPWPTRRTSRASILQRRKAATGSGRHAIKSEPPDNVAGNTNDKSNRETRSQEISPLSDQGLTNSVPGRVRRQLSYSNPRADRRVKASKEAESLDSRHASLNTDPLNSRSGSRLQEVGARRKSDGLLHSSQASATCGLDARTAHISQALRTYRQRLEDSDEVMSEDSVGELEQELASTARALAEKAARNSETVVIGQLLDQYTGKLIELLDERIKGYVTEAVAKTGRSRQDAREEEQQIGLSGTDEVSEEAEEKRNDDTRPASS